MFSRLYTHRPVPFGCSNHTSQCKSRYDRRMGRAGLIGGVGAWLLAAALTLATAAWPEHIRPHPLLVIGLGVAGALMLLVPLIQWFHPIFKDRNTEPLRLDLAIEGVVRTRTGGPQGRWQYGDIFIQASAHLQSPASVQVEYVAEVIRHGVSTTARAIGDVPAWHLAERKDYAIGRKGEYRDIRPLPVSLSRKVKSDGWLHFQVDFQDPEITNCLLRLTSRCSLGAIVVERELIGTLTGPLLMQRKIA